MKIKCILTIISAAAVSALLFSCTAAAAGEEPAWLSSFVVNGDTMYFIRNDQNLNSYVSGKTLHEGYPAVLNGKVPEDGELNEFCYYNDKIYYYISSTEGIGCGDLIYSCDLNGENDMLITDDAGGSAVICDNFLYYEGYEYTDDGWWNDAIYKINLSDISSKEILTSSGPFDWYKENYLTLHYFDGEWLFYESGSGFCKMDKNGGNITALSETQDEFAESSICKSLIYGNKTCYYENGSIYEKDRNGSNAVSLCVIPGEKAYTTEILAVTEDCVYYCVGNGDIYAVKRPEKGISVVLDGETLSFDQEPAVIDGRTMVPLRAIFEAMGYTVSWDQETQTAEAVKGSDSITVQLGSSVISYTLNGKESSYTCDTVPQAINGRTLVPVRAIAECAGCEVEWDSSSKTVTITS